MIHNFSSARSLRAKRLTYMTYVKMMSYISVHHRIFMRSDIEFRAHPRLNLSDSKGPSRNGYNIPKIING